MFSYLLGSFTLGFTATPTLQVSNMDSILITLLVGIRTHGNIL